MKFSLISDMHVDHPQEKTPYELLEKTVVVAGDTGNGLVGLKFLNKLKRKGFDVFATYGNHEHYGNRTTGRSVHETAARFREDFPAIGELEPALPIALRCGWYMVDDEFFWDRQMNDSRNCMLSGTEVNQLCRDDAFYLEQELMTWKDHQYKGVIVTHMAPCEETLNPAFKGDPTNQWYWSPHLRELLSRYSEQIRVWCHGHSHAFMDEVVDGVRVVCNPRGYPGENPGWKPITIEV